MIPYFIAEIGVNHEGDIDVAKSMIKGIAKAGASAAKFQTYKANLLAAKNSPAYWDTSKESTLSQFELFSKYDKFGRADYEELAKVCRDEKIDFISTPFDTDSLHWLIPLMGRVKIASADLTNNLLLSEIAEYRKPVILSVGAATDAEIQESLDLLFERGTPHVTLLHCMLLYPTPPAKGYLSRIYDLNSKFGGVDIDIGYSDHIAPHEANNDQLLAAAAMGATVLEKHYTEDKLLPGNDHYHAVDHRDLDEIIKRLNTLGLMVGDLGSFQSQGLNDQAKAIKHARRGLYYRNNLKVGHMIKATDVIAKRPAGEISPRDAFSLIGRSLKREVVADSPILYDDLSKED
ncbi:MAG: N-acetylneuraminate synthase family protein [Candidatus Azotimanducaceae bacterium]